ncbi:MAG TPA: oligopeptide/dipeptide ABC transporter ATP-binding protein [Pirellulales bacterium]
MTTTSLQPSVEQTKTAAPLLDVRDLKVYFPFTRGHLLKREHGFVRAVDGVSFSVKPGETLGLVGESGCGKSTTARAILNLLHGGGSRAEISGEIRWEGKRIDGLNDSRMLPYRRQMQMIFQDPFASLNPRMTVGAIVAEPMQIFSLHPARQRKLEVLRLLDMVGLNPRYINRYPHEFSGGQRQRIGIARALAVNPKLIFCDEPVSALDVSIQAQVINVLVDLQKQLGLAYVFIAHNLAVVQHISDRIGVMYLGRIVEMADAATLYRQPLHPYTKALLSAVPIPDPVVERQRRRTVLTGDVPSPEFEYAGCRFADRCPIAEQNCRVIDPVLEGESHEVACLVANRDRTAAR